MTTTRKGEGFFFPFPNFNDPHAISQNFKYLQAFLKKISSDGNDAIHDNVASEISAITNKATPTTSDFILIEDAAASNAKKYITVANLEAILRHDSMVAGTVADHSDTTATGAELETLTDGSDADSLHAHGAIQTDEEVADLVGAMVGGNTETGIAVTYEDSDNTLDFVLDSEITTFFGATNLLGAEAETLSDGSIADALHKHTSLYDDDPTLRLDVATASDGMIFYKADGSTASLTYTEASFLWTFDSDVKIEQGLTIVGQLDMNDAAIIEAATINTADGPDSSDWWSITDVDGGDSWMLQQWDNSAAAYLERFEVVGKGTGLTNEGDFVWFDLDGTEILRWDESSDFFELSKGLDLNNSVLVGPLDPSAGTHVGDRDYNDARYTELGILTTAGDVFYATGAGVVVRLGIGTATQLLATNSGATAPEWVDAPTGAAFDELMLIGA